MRNIRKAALSAALTVARHVRGWTRALARPAPRWLGGQDMRVSALALAVLCALELLALVASVRVLWVAAFGAGAGAPSFGLGALMVALLGLPFVIWRSLAMERQTRTGEQGHITDRINKAVEGLGAEKVVKVREFVTLYKKVNGKRATDTDGNPIPLKRGDGSIQGRWEVSEETQANLEVRIGAIYALERIAQDSDRDHVQIMEILCAYIRQNAPASEAVEWPTLEMKESEDDGPLEADWRDRLEAFREAQEEAKAELKPREDIQVALTVIGRRSAEQRQIEAGPGRGQKATFPFYTPCPDYDAPEDGHDPAALDAYLGKLEEWEKTLRAYDGYRLDLRHTNLQGADLSGMNLNGAFLSGARLQGATLWQTELQGAALMTARLQCADLMNARLQGAGLSEARLDRSDLSHARLQSAILVKARLREARLWQTQLQNARLVEAQLQKAFFEATEFDSWTDLREASLDGAMVKHINLSAVPEIAEHLPGMFGDASVSLPDRHGRQHIIRPAHWPKLILNQDKFFGEWRKWLSNRDGYTPPDPPDDAG